MNHTIHLTRAGFQTQSYCGNGDRLNHNGLTTDPDRVNCPACLKMWTSWAKHLKHADRNAGLQSWP